MIRASLGFMGIPLQYRTAGQREAIMRERLAGSIIAVVFAAVAGSIALAMTSTGAAPVATVTTPWSEPDLQGIWTDETDTPLQRSPKYANQEFFTEAQRAELDRQRAAMRG